MHHLSGDGPHVVTTDHNQRWDRDLSETAHRIGFSPPCRVRVFETPTRIAAHAVSDRCSDISLFHRRGHKWHAGQRLAGRGDTTSLTGLEDRHDGKFLLPFPARKYGCCIQDQPRYAIRACERGIEGDCPTKRVTAQYGSINGQSVRHRSNIDAVQVAPKTRNRGLPVASKIHPHQSVPL